MVAAQDLKFCSFGVPVRVRQGVPDFLVRRLLLSKSSLDYSELSGLNIALKNLEIDPNSDQTIVSWIRQRITYLQNK